MECMGAGLTLNAAVHRNVTEHVLQSAFGNV